MDDSEDALEHTYAYMKTGEGNRYLKYAEKWGGLYVGFENFPLSLLDSTYENAKANAGSLLSTKDFARYFHSLKEIYTASLPEWRGKIRLALWNRDTGHLELWQVTDTLRPFPKEFLADIYDDRKPGERLEQSAEFRKRLKDLHENAILITEENVEAARDFLSGPSGCRFLPARRISPPIPSESIYTPIDTLSVWQGLNRWTFRLMTDIDPTQAGWNDGIFRTKHRSIPWPPRGRLVTETGYGRFVREYLDGLAQNCDSATLTSLSAEQRTDLVCLTLNPLMVETAAMLFAIDIGMVIDSGVGKGRHGIDVIAACGKGTGAQDVINRLGSLGITLQPNALESLVKNRTMAFQCKGYDGDEIGTARFVEFRPLRSRAKLGRSVISLRELLEQTKDTKTNGLFQLRGWLDRMCELVIGPNANGRH